jgi:molecular chaperone GrpE (heat shock protein)
MLRLLKRWFGRPEAGTPKTDATTINSRSESQALRLELQERDRVIAALKGDLERLRHSASDRLAEALQAERERLLADAAGPVSQLLTQAHLLEVEGKPIPARDVLAVARRLLRLLEDEGLTPEGRVGETVAFDPNRHELLSGDIPLTPGQPAIVRIVGVACRGKILRKVGVVLP